MTITEAQAALSALLTAAGVPTRDPGSADPPYAVVYQDGAADLARITPVTPWRFRATIVAGAWDTTAASDQLSGLVQAALAALRAAPGWAIVEARRTTIVTLGGADLLSADIIVTTNVTL